MEFYRPTLDEIIRKRRKALTSAEKRLLDCCKTGEWAHLGMTVPDAPTDANEIDAALIRFLMLGGDGQHINSTEISVIGAYISGVLNFEGCETSASLFLFNVRMMTAPNFKNSRLVSLTVSGGYFPGLLGSKVFVTQDVRLHGGAHFDGKVDLSGACIEGIFDSAYCTFRSGNQDALDCEGLVVREGVSLSEGVCVFGCVRLRDAKIGGLNLNNAAFDGEGHTALNCEGLEVAGNVHIRHGFQPKGEVRFHRAKIKGTLVCENRAEYKKYFEQLTA